MSSDEQRRFAWQPLTPRGVAAFGHATLGRLTLVQLCFAIMAAAAIAWTIHARWFPVISTAINRLPAQGSSRNGQLLWQGDSPQTLSENRFLALTIDLDHQGQARSPAHIQVEFGRSAVKVFSLLGYVEARYPRSYIISFNRPELTPWWGAWAPELLALVIGGIIAGLFFCWALLAAIYCPLVWLCAFFANRDLTLRQSWHLAGAALMPGALVMNCGLVLYGLGALDPVRLLATLSVHFCVGWIFLVVSPFYLPRHPTGVPPSSVNPFGTEKSPGQKAEDAGKV